MNQDESLTNPAPGDSALLGPENEPNLKHMSQPNLRLGSQLVLILLGVITLGLFTWLLVAARPFINAMLVAGLLAYLLNPAVHLVERRLRWRRSGATNLVFSATLLSFVGALVGLGATFWKQADRLELELYAALGEMESWLSQPLVILGFEFDLQPLLVSIEESTSNALTRMPLGSGTVLSSVSSNIMWTLVVLVSLYYLLKDGRKFKAWLVSQLPEMYQAEGSDLLIQIDAVWGVFLRMQLLIFAILTVLVGVSSLLIIWLYRIGWLPLSPFGLVILLLVVYTAIQQVDNLWLRPRLMGRTLQLHPGVVIVSLIAALALSGVFMALIIVPLIATLRIVIRHFHGKFLSILQAPDREGMELHFDISPIAREQTQLQWGE